MLLLRKEQVPPGDPKRRRVNGAFFVAYVWRGQLTPRGRHANLQVPVSGFPSCVGSRTAVPQGGPKLRAFLGVLPTNVIRYSARPLRREGAVERLPQAIPREPARRQHLLQPAVHLGHVYGVISSGAERSQEPVGEVHAHPTDEAARFADAGKLDSRAANVLRLVTRGGVVACRMVTQVTTMDQHQQ